MGWRWDGQNSSDTQCPFGVCVEGGAEGGLGGHVIRHQCCFSSKIFVTLIFHDHLHCCEIFFARFLIPFVFKQPLHLVFNKAATIVLNRISSFHIV